MSLLSIFCICLYSGVFPQKRFLTQGRTQIITYNNNIDYTIKTLQAGLFVYLFILTPIEFFGSLSIFLLFMYPFFLAPLIFVSLIPDKDIRFVTFVAKTFPNFFMICLWVYHNIFIKLKKEFMLYFTALSGFLLVSAIPVKYHFFYNVVQNEPLFTTNNMIYFLISIIFCLNIIIRFITNISLRIGTILNMHTHINVPLLLTGNGKCIFSLFYHSFEQTTFNNNLRLPLSTLKIPVSGLKVVL